MFRASSPQDTRNQNAVEISVSESMSSCVKAPSVGSSICPKSNQSVCSSSADLYSTGDRSSPLPGPTQRQSSGEDDSESFYPCLKLPMSAIKHKKSF